MATLTFPSEQFPAVPAVSFELPTGWTGQVVDGALLAGLHDHGPDSFAANLIVGFTRHRPGLTHEQAEQSLLSYAQSLPEVEMTEMQRPTIGGRLWSVLPFAYVHPQIGTIVQVVATTVVERGPVVDSMRVTGTALPDQTDDLQAIRAAIDSLVVAD
ncbi:MAG: hypothetical protein LBL55_09040 [Propionibacteriaceae bacterium]|jgi:hypothetical protein|nr:hypothetical protein [Propionibacteriaceae bacterium]